MLGMGVGGAGTKLRKWGQIKEIIMKKLEILGKKLRKIRDIVGCTQEMLSTNLEAIVQTTDYAITKDNGKKKNIGFSYKSIRRFEKGEISDRNKNFIAEIYSIYCRDKKERPQITPKLILNDGKSDFFLEKVWNGVPTESDFLDFESSISLLDIPIEDDAELQKPDFFRLTGPEYTDFKNKYVHYDDAKIRNFLNLLKEKKILLFLLFQ